MVTVIGVRFRHAGKVYYFHPGAIRIDKGDYVIVETSRGVEYGLVVSGARLAGEEDIVPPLRTVIRKATDKDKETYQKNMELEKSAFKICEEKIAKHGLEMKLIDVEYTFDGNKILFHFTANGRVDFRELVKDLASVFRTRIELRQIGVRDETKMGCGIGICGRKFCCSSFLSDFAPVSIKMAKDQSLSLNPTKISGTCGRLMCCLKYEQNTYEDLNKRLPDEGDIVETPDGAGEVLHVNVLRQLIKVGITQDKGDVQITEYALEDLKILQHRRHKNQNEESLDQEEAKALKELEREFHEPKSGHKDKEQPKREHREHREHRGEHRDNHEHRENRENRDNHEHRENRDNRDNHERREAAAPQEEAAGESRQRDRQRDNRGNRPHNKGGRRFTSSNREAGGNREVTGHEAGSNSNNNTNKKA